MLKALLEKRGTLVAAMGALLTLAETENRDLTATEIADYDAKKAEAAALQERITRLEGQEALEASLTEVRPGVGRRTGIADVPRRGAEAKTEFGSIGEFMHAVRFNTNDQRLNYVEAAGSNGELRAESRMDDGPSGGFAIPPQFRDTLLKLTPQQAIIRPRAQVIPAGSPPDAPVTMPALDQTGAAPGNMFGGVQVTWIGEGGTKPNTDMKLREVTLTPHEVAGSIVVTDKLLRNWQASDALLTQQLRGACSQAEDFAFLKGDGIAKPLGILNAGATYKVARTTANSISYDDVVEMAARCYGNGVFVYSRSALPALRKLRDPQGHYIWAESAREGEPSMLIGMSACSATSGAPISASTSSKTDLARSSRPPSTSISRATRR
jgi:HK97 family phage major capsid protein